MNVDTSQRGGWSYHWDALANWSTLHFLGMFSMMFIPLTLMGLFLYFCLKDRWANEGKRPQHRTLLKVLKAVIPVAVLSLASAFALTAGHEVNPSAKERHIPGMAAEYHADLTVPAPAAVVEQRYKNAMKKTYGLEYLSGAWFDDFDDTPFYDFYRRDTEILAKDSQGRLNTCRTFPDGMEGEWIYKVNLFCTPENKITGGTESRETPSKAASAATSTQ